MAACFDRFDNINEITRSGINADGSLMDDQPFGTNFNNNIHRETAENISKEQKARNELMDGINATINADPALDSSQVGIPFTNSVKQAANLLGRMSINPTVAREGLRQRAVDVMERLRLWSQVNPAHYSKFEQWYLNFTNGLKERLASGFAPLEKVFLKYAPDEGNTSGANRVIQSLYDIGPKQSAFFKDVHDNHLMAINRTAQDIANRTGFNTEDVRHDLGVAVQALAIPERTKYLLDKMDRNIQDLSERLSRDGNNGELAEELNSAISYRDSFNEWSQMDTPVDDKGHRMVTAGWSIPEAERVLLDIQQKLNVDRPTLESIAEQFRTTYKYIQTKRAEAGLINSDVFNDPLLQSLNTFFPFRMKADMDVGFQNDGNMFNPGSLHEMQGIRNPEHLADSYSVLERFAKRAGTELATNDLALNMYMLGTFDTRDSTKPIVKYDYNDLVKQTKGESQGVAHIAGSIIRGDFGGGLIANIPITDKNGSTTLKRFIVMFNPNFKDADLNLTGRILNDALRWNERESNSIVQKLGNATGLFSTLYTKFNFSFAPINHLRDMGERFINMGNQSYRLENGGLVNGSQFRMAYAANGRVAWETLAQYLKGQLDPNSLNGKFMQEYVDSGLKQEFTLGQDYKNINDLKKALEERGVEGAGPLARQIASSKDFRGLRQVLSSLSEPVRNTALKFFDTYNDFLNNLAPLAQYITLRQHGVEMGSARSGVRELMDLHQRGQATGFLRMLYPFVVPTIQGGMAMFKGLGLAPNASGHFKPTKQGAYTFIGMLAAYGVVNSFMKSALGTDEDGNSRMDSLPITDLARYISIPTSDKDFIKLPLPFGASQIAATLAVTADRFSRGKVTPEDALFDTVAALVRNITPMDVPTYMSTENPVKSLLAMITPTLLTPISLTAMNINAFGRTLTFEQESTGLVPLSEQGRASTSQNYHEMARWLQQKTGLDLAPEQYQNIVEGYAGGILKLFVEYFKQDSIRAAGIDKTTQEILGPIGTAFGLASVYKHTGDLNRFYYYQEKNKLDKEVRKLGIHPPSKLSGEERFNWYRNALSEKGMNDNDIDRVIMFERADQELTKLSRNVNTQLKTNGAILDYGDTDALKDLFRDWALQREEIYRSVRG